MKEQLANKLARLKLPERVKEIQEKLTKLRASLQSIRNQVRQNHRQE